MSNGSATHFQNGHLDEHSRLDKPIHGERHLKVICVGAGASGLIFAYKLQRSFENFSLTVYEKNPDITGTWYENVYPGCACDIPAHTYTWSFEPKVDWSSVYAGSAEIYKYFDDFSRKYDLRKYCKLNHAVTSAHWDEKHGKWNVSVTDLTTGIVIHDNCDIFVNATGILNAWKWPAIPGLETYKGTLLHTARWDKSVDLTGKHVGLIGNGSSAIQVLPAIHPVVSKITTFIRGPTWVSPVQNITQHNYTEEERKEFATNPEVFLSYRKTIEISISSIFPMFISGSEVQIATNEAMITMMKAKLQNKVFEDKLIPRWGVGCKRITPGVNYLETLGSEKVEVVYGQVDRITERGCVCDDGNEYPVDVLICATGFDTSFQPRFPIIGPGRKNLIDEWTEEPKGYLGMAAPGFPNYFVFLGPNSPVGNGPLLCAMEAQADYMLKMIDRWQTENIHSFSPKLEAVEDFIAHKDQFMRKTIWDQECHSWYKKSPSGKIIALWPGSTSHYLEAIAEPRYDDWNIQYSGNRFAFLGNGFSQTEADQTADWAYYVRSSDDSPFISRGKKLRVANKSGTVVHEASSGGRYIL